MRSVIEVQDLIKGKANPSDVESPYVILKLKIGMGGFNMSEALDALNMMANNGWKFITFLSAGKDAGFILERKN